MNTELDFVMIILYLNINTDHLYYIKTYITQLVDILFYKSIINNKTVSFTKRKSKLCVLWLSFKKVAYYRENSCHY